jgi:radical SAM protein with 4Fe4S-binding SPASM domain
MGSRQQEPGYVDLRSPAGIAIAAIVYNYDGDVYASDEARMLAEMGEHKFRLGNLHRDSYEAMLSNDDLMDAIESSITVSSPTCTDCAFLPYCGSDPVYHYATQRDTVGNKALSGFCRKNMGIFRHLITLMEEDTDSRRIMQGWAT